MVSRFEREREREREILKKSKIVIFVISRAIYHISFLVSRFEREREQIAFLTNVRISLFFFGREREKINTLRKKNYINIVI